MSKLKKSILIIGILVIAVAASLATALALFATDAIKTDPIELVFAVRDEQKVYDGTPLKASEYKLVSGELISGHEERVEFLGEQTAVGVSQSDLSVKIYDADGYNVSSSYTIKVEGGELAVTKKAVSVIMPTQKVEYAGSKVIVASYALAEDSSDLVSGHKILASSEAGLINVGDTLPQDLKPLVYDAAGSDVTENYEIEFTQGEIEVLPRKISVRPVSYSKVYDGVKIKAGEIEYLEGSLVEGHRATYSINYGYNDSLANAGVLETEVTDFMVFDTVDGEEVDVTSNYEIDCSETGEINITPRPLTVVAKSEEWTYDGSEHSLTSDTVAKSVEGLAETDQIISVSYAGALTNVGEVENFISSIQLSCITSNYSITPVNGTLTVKPYRLEINTGDGEKYYDGEPLFNTDADMLLPNEEHTVTYRDGFGFPSITEAGSVENKILCVISDGSGRDVTSNYDVVYTYGTLTVKRMPVTVTLADKEVVYSGENNSPDLIDDGEEYFSLWALDAEHTKSLALTREHFEVVPYVKSMIDAGEYKYSVKFTDDPVLGNYELTVANDGYLTVAPKRLDVTTETLTRKYNGKPLMGGGFDPVDGDLVEGHSAVVSGQAPSITAAGEIENLFAIKIIDDETGANQTANYDIRYTYGTLTVEKRGVQVVLEAEKSHDFDNRVYNVQPKDVIQSITIETIEDDAGDNPLLDKDDFKVVCDEILNFKDDGYEYTVEISDKVAARNFALTVNQAKITVQPVKVKVELKNFILTYNGAKQELDVNQAITSIDTSLLSASDFRVTIEEEETDANAMLDQGTYHYVVVMRDAAFAKNFDISLITTAGKSGQILVQPLPVKVTLNDVNFTYNGQDRAINAVEALTIDTKLLTADYFSVEVKDKNNIKAVIKNADTYYYTAKLKPNSDVNDANYNSANFSVTFLDGDGDSKGKVTVEKLTVTVTLKNYTAKYSGAAFELDEANAIIGIDTDLVTYENLGISVEGGTQITNVGDYTYTAVGDETNFTYVINKGSVKIEPLPVTVTLANPSKVYDGSAATIDANSAIAAISVSSDLLEKSDFSFGFSDATSDKSLVGVHEFAVKFNGSDEEAKNFEFTYTSGAYTIAKRSVTLVTDGYEGYYDGTEHSAGTATVYGLNGSDGTIITSLTGVTAEAATEDIPAIKNAGRISNAFVCKILKGGNEITDNFEITYVYGELVVNPAEVEVTLSQSVSKTYDGTVQELTLNGDIATLSGNGSGVLSLSDLKIEYSSPVKDAGNYTFTVKFLSDKAANNYDLTVTDGKIEVKKADLTVTLKAYSGTYSGKKIEVPVSAEYIVVGTNGDNLAAADFEIVYSHDIYDAGTDYEYGIRFVNSENYKNYNLNFAKGKITVNKLTINLTLKSDFTFVYSGEEVVLDPMRAIVALEKDGELFTKSEFAIDFGGAQPLKQGTYEYTVKLKDGTRAKNFDFAAATGTVKITPRKLYVMLNPVTSVTGSADDDLNLSSYLTIAPGSSLGYGDLLVFNEGIIGSGNGQPDDPEAWLDKDEVVLTITRGDDDISDCYDVDYLNVTVRGGVTYLTAPLLGVNQDLY